MKECSRQCWQSNLSLQVEEFDKSRPVAGLACTGLALWALYSWQFPAFSLLQEVADLLSQPLRKHLCKPRYEP